MWYAGSEQGTVGLPEDQEPTGVDGEEGKRDCI